MLGVGGHQIPIVGACWLAWWSGSFGCPQILHEIEIITEPLLHGRTVTAPAQIRPCRDEGHCQREEQVHGKDDLPRKHGEGQSPKGKNAGPYVHQQDCGAVGVTNIHQPVVEMATVSRPGRTPPGRAPDHRQAEVQQRQEEHRERKQDGNDRGDTVRPVVQARR